jgi:hypothetical protein
MRHCRNVSCEERPQRIGNPPYPLTAGRNAYQARGESIFFRLLKKGQMQVELCEIPFAGAPLPSPKRLRAGRRNPEE